MDRSTELPSHELLEHVTAGTRDNVASVCRLLDARYDDLESGRIKSVPDEEVFARIRVRSAARQLEISSRP